MPHDPKSPAEPQTDRAALERAWRARMDEACATAYKCRRTVTPANPTIRERLARYEPTGAG
jgi:hypothetical protein